MQIAGGVATGLALAGAGTAIVRPDLLRKGKEWLLGGQKKKVDAPVKVSVEEDDGSSMKVVAGVSILVIAIISIAAFFMLRGRS